MRLSTLADPNQEFEWQGLHLVYNAALWTPRLVAKFLNVQDRPTGDQLESVIEVLSLILISWDLTDDQDQPIPTTVEGLQDVPLTVLNPLVQAILEDSQPSSEEGNALRQPSSIPYTDSTQQPQTPPNGTDPSSSPPVLASPSPT